MKQNSAVWLSTMALWCCHAAAQSQPITIRFRAMIGGEEFACGRSYHGVGATRSTIAPRDLRFYVYRFRLIDVQGQEVPVDLNQGDRWQLDDLALLDFEDGTGACDNGTPERNMAVTGSIHSGQFRGLRFMLGVPEGKNHADMSAMPPPLNLTAMFWSWNNGHKFLRLELTSKGRPRGYAFHLGSTGCHPDASAGGRGVRCLHPNLASVDLPDFEPSRSEVVLDLDALLSGVDLDNPGGGDCLSEPGDAGCAPLFRALGLDSAEDLPHPQTVFHTERRVNP
jgi:uncharacterized repeat protein (TIGR04052 family)